MSDKTDNLSEERVGKPADPPKLCCFVYLLAVMAVLGGFQCGYNTGNISSALLHATRNDYLKPVSHAWQEAIVAGMPIFAAIGALFAGKLGDKFGRRKMIISSTTIFGIGSIVCALAIHKVMLFFGRMLLGIALGVASMIIPVYVGECAPTHVRGQMLSAFNIFLCFGQCAANIVAGFAAYVDPDNTGWRIMFGFAAVPAVIQLVGFIFLPESPRWLFVNGQEKRSRSVLKKIYHNRDDWVDFELAEISVVHEQEVASREKSGAQNEYTIVTVMKTPHVRKSLWIGCSLCVFQQLSGIDTIMYYTGPLIRSAGIKDEHTIIWLSLGTSFVNFFGTVLPFFVIERFGRRTVLLVSTALTILALIALGSSFLALNLDTNPSVGFAEMHHFIQQDVEFDPRVEALTHCLSKMNCDYCVTDDKCGYCSLAEMDTGLCLPKDPHNLEHSLTGYCSKAYNETKFGNFTFDWEEGNCETKLTVLPLILMVVYLLCFALGLSTIPWVLNAEIYPLWARGTCVSVATCAIWSANAFISLTFLTFASAISRFGTFYLYAVITMFALYVFYKHVPDTSGYSLDEVEILFMTPDQREKHIARLHGQMARKQSKAKRGTDESSDNIDYETLGAKDEDSSSN